MNKSAIRNFAVWARQKLKADVAYAMGMVGITPKGIAEPLPQSTADTQFFDIGTKDYVRLDLRQVRQRRALVSALTAKKQELSAEAAFDALVEEAAYTWFNRLAAIRFMEVNDYLPGRVRVLSSETPGKLEPDLVTTPFDGGLDFTLDEEEAIHALQQNGNRQDELFRLLFLKECAGLSEVLPVLFDRAAEWTELVMNLSFTDSDGVVYRLTHDIPEDDFNVEKEGQVEIVGWLYQYYNTELKDETFALLKKNVKITKERIPSATQLFTPDWIVRYMVENSLGRLWLEGHSDEHLQSAWRYYLEEAPQEPEVASRLAAIRKGYAAMNPEDIRIIDPCMGSGHILVYAFDVLMQIYLSLGYTERDAVRSILENNLYGLDIDRRAAQLAYFAVMMKARQYDRRILTRGIMPHVHEIVESRRNVDVNMFRQFGMWRELAAGLYEQFIDAKEYGSILKVDLTLHDLQMLRDKLREMKEAVYASFMDEVEAKEAVLAIEPLMDQAEILAQKYDVVVTNPPYMSSSGFSTKLAEFVKNNYPDTKSDMSTVCMEKALNMCKINGFMSMINIPVWMFISSFEKIRSKIVLQKRIVSMLHNGRGIFGSDFGSVAFVIANNFISSYCGCYRKLFEKVGNVESNEAKEKRYLSGYGAYTSSDKQLLKIPGNPIAYWASNRMLDAFQKEALANYCLPIEGIKTGDNDRFLRLWFEPDCTTVGRLQNFVSDSKLKWCYTTKGGAFRKWYGNTEYVTDWSHNGETLNSFSGSSIYKKQYWYMPAVTWTYLTAGSISVRSIGEGFLYNNKGPAIFGKDQNLLNYTMAMINSKIGAEALSYICSTLTFLPGDLKKLPLIIDKSKYEEVLLYTEDNLDISKVDWDSFETSWDFQRHPLLQDLRDGTSVACAMQKFYGYLPKSSCPLETEFLLWQGQCNDRFTRLKANEEELNRIFIEIYGLQDELAPEVAEKDVTVRRADLSRDVRSFISYAVGCMLGRYSLDTPGLAYAGGEWDAGKYRTYLPDEDNCLPIPDEDYGMRDDIVNRFVDFVRTAFGPDSLEANLQYIAAALGNKGATARETIRLYFLNDFYKDHCSTYSVTGSGKRPIYWLFDSGKQNGFKALVYMHRWNADTAGHVRVEYLHKMQHVYESEIQRMQEIADQSHDSREAARAEKRLLKLRKQLKETQDYDARLGHIALSRIDIDLDDGVKVNYEKVQTGRDGKKLEVLGKI